MQQQQQQGHLLSTNNNTPTTTTVVGTDQLSRLRETFMALGGIGFDRQYHTISWEVLDVSKLLSYVSIPAPAPAGTKLT